LSEFSGVLSNSLAKDDGTPDQYDLPPPNKEGAIPLSTSANGDVKQANGRVSVGEDDRWARDRTGWAPRFGTGNPEDSAGDTLLDHQTFLDSKLHDKFFGGKRNRCKDRSENTELV
jgi:hypothetical protein